ncbi:hypothetical protein JCM3770_000651 [Rhodotorula araucariae]
MSDLAPEKQLRAALSHANTLLGLVQQPQPPASKPSLAAVLHSRLAAYHALVATPHLRATDAPVQDDFKAFTSNSSERALQSTTALAALALLERISALLPSLRSSVAASPAPSTSSAPSRDAAPPPPVFGLKDTKALGQLAGVVARWGIQSDAPGARGAGLPQPRIAEIAPEDEADEQARPARREDIVRRVVRLLHLDGEVDLALMPASEKQFLGTVLPQVLPALLGALAQLSAGAAGAWAREALERLFKITPTQTVLSTILALVAGTRPSSPSRARLSALLSMQLLRPGGVRSLFLVVVGVGAAGGGDDDVSVQKLEMVRRVLETPPAGGDEQAYYANVTAQLLDLLRLAASSSLSAALEQYPPASSKGKSRLAPPPRPPPSAVPVPIIRAAAWCLAHLVVTPPPTPTARAASQSFLATLHAPLLPASHPPPAHAPLSTRAAATHLTLVALVALYAPPLPTLLRTLLGPVLPALLALLSRLAHPPLVVAADARGEGEALARVMGDEAAAVLRAWARAADVSEVVAAVSGAVERWEAGETFGRVRHEAEDVRGHGDGDGAGAGEWEWAWADGGGVELRPATADTAPEEGVGELDAPLGVDAVWLVGWIKDLERKELAAALFLRWLDEIKVLRGVDSVQGARRTVTRLQLVLQMVEHLGSDILADPREIVAFVAHALDAEGGEPATAASSGEKKNAKKTSRERSGLEGLRIVDEDDEEFAPKVQEVDDDESEFGLGTGFGEDEMAMTALTLLLAVLEADETLDMTNTPLLAVIYTQLDTLQSSNTSPLIPPLAREARMVLSLRRASSAFAASTPASTADGAPDPLAASRETYRTALKLLQDPLLPVRAQGLHLLRSLVLDKEHALLSTDPALLPAVLDIFVGALEEEDSFLYLNAVQGLSSLVDVFGRQVIGRLMEVYTGTRKGYLGGPKEVGDGERGTRELDKRLRVGETLVQVIHRAGEALGVLIDDLLPPLLVVLRSSNLPIPLRASAITILASCVETAPAALVQHADVLTEACVTLLQVESVPLAPRSRAPPPAAKGKEKQARPAALIEEVSSSSSSESEDDGPAPAPSLGKDSRPRRPEELPDPTTTSSKHPTLRRAAAVFLGALVRTAAHQAAAAAEQRERAHAAYDERDPFGLGGGRIRMPFAPDVRADRGEFLLRARGAPAGGDGDGIGALIAPEQLVRARTVLRYVSETDADALVREQTAQVLRELDDA